VSYDTRSLTRIKPWGYNKPVMALINGALSALILSTLLPHCPLVVGPTEPTNAHTGCSCGGCLLTVTTEHTSNTPGLGQANTGALIAA
jgi:hypothetical protein